MNILFSNVLTAIFSDVLNTINFFKTCKTILDMFKTIVLSSNL